LNYAPKFCQDGGFSAPNFVFLEENFLTITKPFDRLKFIVGPFAPSATSLVLRLLLLCSSMLCYGRIERAKPILYAFGQI